MEVADDRPLSLSFANGTYDAFHVAGTPDKADLLEIVGDEVDGVLGVELL